MTIYISESYTCRNKRFGLRIYVFHIQILVKYKISYERLDNHIKDRQRIREAKRKQDRHV